MTSQREDSTVYVSVPLTSVPDGVDLSLDTFEMAFVKRKNETVTAWEAATYDPVTNEVFLLVGSANSGLVVAPGTYYVLVRVTDNPEIPVIFAHGKLAIMALVP